jgi:hypothetical protein
MEADDGSVALFTLLVDSAEEYKEFAAVYYEVNIPIEAVQAIYDLAPLTERLVMSLNSELTIANAIVLATEIGYPIKPVH